MKYLLQALIIANLLIVIYNDYRYHKIHLYNLIFFIFATIKFTPISHLTYAAFLLGLLHAMPFADLTIWVSYISLIGMDNFSTGIFILFIFGGLYVVLNKIYFYHTYVPIGAHISFCYLIYLLFV